MLLEPCSNIEAEDIGAEPEGAGINPLVKNPFPGVTLNARRACRLNIEGKVIADSTEKDSSPKLTLAMHAPKIQDSSEEHQGIW